MGVIQRWREDSKFAALTHQIGTMTLVDTERQYMLYQFARMTLGMAGHVAEIGVYRGGTAKILGEVFTQKSVYLFDTFNGMPECDPTKDLHRKGNFSDTSLEAVQQYLKSYPNMKFQAGFFPDTAKYLTQHSFCFVHADGDIYQTTKDVIEFFYPRLNSGGILLFDDYGAQSCPGCKLAVDQAFTKEQIIYIPTGQAVIFK